MRPSRGMGAMSSMKMKKLRMPTPRTVVKRDGDEPVSIFKRGGKIIAKLNPQKGK